MPTKAALLGAAHPHGAAYLETLQISDLVSGIFVFDEDVQALKEITRGKTEKIESARDDLPSLLDRGDISFGIAALPTDINASLCEQLFEAGVHVFSEKPVAKTALEIERLNTLSSRQGLKFGVAYCTRFHPVARKAQQLIQEGAIGRITSVEARFITSQVRYRDPGHWLFSSEKAGGGILSWLGCHYLDLMRFILRDEVTAVSMMVDTFSDEKIDVEDVASLSFRFGKGSIGSLQLGYQLAMSARGYIEGSYDSYFCIRGDKGQINCDFYSGIPTLKAESIAINWGADGRKEFEFELPVVGGYCGSIGLSSIEQFIQSIIKDEEPVATGQDALQVARIVEAAYQSNESGRTVTLSNN